MIKFADMKIKKQLILLLTFITIVTAVIQAGYYFIITLESELYCISNYASIMHIRYKGKYKLMIKASPDVKQLYILKMILQPIVENSVYHGFKRIKKTGYVLIKANCDFKDSLIIQVIDNGKGIEKRKLEELKNALTQEHEYYSQSQSKKDIALHNINSRIKLNYGKDYGISVLSRYNY